MPSIPHTNSDARQLLALARERMAQAERDVRAAFETVIIPPPEEGSL